jgi:hypothetical protein
MGEVITGLEKPVSALDRLDTNTADTLRLVLGQRAPDVLRALEETDDPPIDLRERVATVFIDEFTREVSGPDWEPTSHGLRVDDALGWFYKSFPIERR